MSEGESRSLTRREFDAVIRRAAELATSDPEGSEGALSEVELFRIAGEVGLDDGHVRRALAEVRSGEAGGGILDRVFGPSSVRVSRVVPGTVEALSAEVDEFMVANQLLQRVRRGPDVLLYRPAVDWASQLARAASFSSRKYYVASAKAVEVRLERVDDRRTLIEFLVDPGTRKDDIAGAIIGGAASAGLVGVLTGAGVTAVAAFPVAVGAGVVLGGAMWVGVGHLIGLNHKKKLGEVRTELEDVLDRLEMGDSLEPPPASWRRWVKRNFHGVARDLMGSDDT
jgi:hypothetical protein